MTVQIFVINVKVPHDIPSRHRGQVQVGRYSSTHALTRLWKGWVVNATFYPRGKRLGPHYTVA